MTCTPIMPTDVPERDQSVSRMDDTYEYVHNLQPEGSNDEENMESATSPYEYVHTGTLHLMQNHLTLILKLNKQFEFKISWAAYGPGNLNRLEIVVID